MSTAGYFFLSDLVQPFATRQIAHRWRAARIFFEKQFAFWPFWQGIEKWRCAHGLSDVRRWREQVCTCEQNSRGGDAGID